MQPASFPPFALGVRSVDNAQSVYLSTVARSYPKTALVPPPSSACKPSGIVGFLYLDALYIGGMTLISPPTPDADMSVLFKVCFECWQTLPRRDRRDRWQDVVRGVFIGTAVKQ